MPKLKLSSLNENDINLYFNNSCVRVFGLDAQPRWYGMHGFGGQYDLLLKGEEGVKTIPKEIWKKSVLFQSVFPHGFFNYKNSTVHCSRIPVRNVSQGISKNNFLMESAEELVHGFGMTRGMTAEKAAHYVASIMTPSRIKLSAALLNKLFEPATYSKDVTKAMDEVRRGAAFSRALSSSMALVPHPCTKGSLVIFDRMPIGECIDKGIVHSLVKEFVQELKDMFVPFNIQVVEKAGK